MIVILSWGCIQGVTESSKYMTMPEKVRMFDLCKSVKSRVCTLHASLNTKLRLSNMQSWWGFSTCYASLLQSFLAGWPVSQDLFAPLVLIYLSFLQIYNIEMMPYEKHKRTLRHTQSSIA